MAGLAAYTVGIVFTVFFAGGLCTSIDRVADLKAAMYTRRNAASACVRLLNASSVIGCAADIEQGPLLHMANALLDNVSDHPAGLRVLLVDEAQLEVLLPRLRSDSRLRARVAGVLVAPGAARPLRSSPAAAFPLAELAPYAPGAWAWNTGGADLLRDPLPVPVFLLDGEAAADARRRAAVNTRQGGAAAQHVAELRAPMMASANSSHCIAERTCLPLGGHSVWAALPPLPADETADRRPVVLVLAGTDGDALFHDQIRGAEAPLSGLVALLAAAEVLGNASAASNYTRRLVFAALAGEPWGLMGSRRLLWQMHAGHASTRGLSLIDIEQVVELGQVGQAMVSGGARTYYVHHQHGSEWGSATPLVDAFQAAAAAGQGAQVEVKEASRGNPGIPPSSLMAFLKARPAIAGVVMADFDESFTNPHYHSRLDNASTIDEESIVAASLVAAHALYALASDHRSPVLQVDEAAVRSTVAMLAACLLRSDPGLACPLARNLTAIVGDPAAPHYVGILRALPADDQDPDVRVVGDVSRLIWNFLAQRSAAGPGRLASGEAGGCDVTERRCEAGAVCLKFHADRRGEAALGYCVNATVRFVTSHSNSLACQGCDAEGAGQWMETDEADAWAAERKWPQDPMWTESTWPNSSPSFVLYQRESTAVERRVLLGGCLLTAASFLGAWAARAVYARHGKQL